jgi:hypothetical protein
VGAALLAAAPAAASGREPTEYEQYMVELINRARLDPEGEVIRLGTGDLNEGPPTLGGHVYTIPAGPKQPLAVSVFIVEAAAEYADLMNDSDTLCHTCFGTNAQQRMWLAGYVPLLSYFDFFDIAGYTLAYGGAQDPSCTSGCPTWVPGRENIAFRAEWPPNGQIDDLLGAIDQAHEDFFNDFDASSRGHRSTLLYGEWKEIGIGIVEGEDGAGSMDSLYLVQNYAHRSDTGPFLTGVAYDDLDDDGATASSFRSGYTTWSPPAPTGVAASPESRSSAAGPVASARTPSSIWCPCPSRARRSGSSWAWRCSPAPAACAPRTEGAPPAGGNPLAASAARNGRTRATLDRQLHTRCRSTPWRARVDCTPGGGRQLIECRVPRASPCAHGAARIALRHGRRLRRWGRRASSECKRHGCCCCSR